MDEISSKLHEHSHISRPGGQAVRGEAGSGWDVLRGENQCARVVKTRKFQK